MKRRRQQEHDEEIARAQADARREALLAELRARQAGGQEPLHEPEPSAEEPPTATGAPDAETADEPSQEPGGDAA